MQVNNFVDYFTKKEKEEKNEKDIKFIIDAITKNRWFSVYYQKNNTNYNDIIDRLKILFNKATNEQKNEVFNYVFNNTDIIVPHYYYIFIDDIFKDKHEELYNKINIDNGEKILKLFYMNPHYYSSKINKNLLDNQLVEIFRKLKIVNYKIFSIAMTLGYIECVKYFFEQKILIKDNLIFETISQSHNYIVCGRYNRNSDFHIDKYIKNFTNLYKIVQEYHNISYDEMLALLINKIPIDISGFNLDDTFYKLNNIYKVYDIKKKTNDNILEILCETNPKLTEVKKIINKKKNSIKPTQKCLENLAINGTRSEVLSFILENSDCILTEDLLIRFENMKKDSISSIIKKKYIEQIIELKTNHKKEVKNVEK
jgi:hypothetical protein